MKAKCTADMKTIDKSLCICLDFHHSVLYKTQILLSFGRSLRREGIQAAHSIQVTQGGAQALLSNASLSWKEENAGILFGSLIKSFNKLTNRVNNSSLTWEIPECMVLYTIHLYFPTFISKGKILKENERPFKTQLAKPETA